MTHLLHLFAHFLIRIEKLGNTTVDTDSFTLCQVASVVFLGNTLGMARIDNTERVSRTCQVVASVVHESLLPVEQIGDHVKFLFCHSNVLRIDGLLTLHTTTKERHVV